MPKRCGSGTCFSRICAAGGSTLAPGVLERVDERAEVLLEQVVAEVHHEVVVAEEVAGDQHAVREAERSVLRDVRDLGAPLRAVAERRHHLVARVADDHADLGDAGGDHRLDAVEQDRLVGDRHELLGPGVGDRPQTRAGTAGQDQTFHDVLLMTTGESPTAPRRRASVLTQATGGGPPWK